MSGIANKLMSAAGGGAPEGAWDLSYAYYDDPLAWDVSTTVYSGKSLSVLTQEGNVQEVFFKPDGLKMYIIGNTGDEVNEYNLSTAWDVSTATYLQVFSVSAQDTSPTGLFFKPDGTKMYVVGNDNGVSEYDLSTAWNISTASYLQNFSVVGQETQPSAVFFKPDGTKMYVLGYTGRDVNEYDLSTAWDVTTASFLQLFSVAAQETVPAGLSFRPDGTKMYIVGFTGDDVNEYDLSTAWDVSTATYLQVFSVAAQDTVPQGLFFKPDGSAFYIAGGTNDRVYQYSLGGFSVIAQDTIPSAMFFKSDGLKMYVVGQAGDEVNEYDLSTAWDTSTASFLQRFFFGTQDTVPRGLSFKPDGTKMYMSGTTNDNVYEYDLSTAWDVSTASFLQSFSVAAQENFPIGLFFKPDGTKFYMSGISSGAVNEYNISTAWDVSTASYLQNFSVAAQDNAPLGIFFKPDGTKMYVIGGTGDDVNEYDLSTAWDVSTASFLQLFSVAAQEIGQTGLSFKDDGTQMFIVGGSARRVFSYTLGPQE